MKPSSGSPEHFRCLPQKSSETLIIAQADA
jgi:hypothetical protein